MSGTPLGERKCGFDALFFHCGCAVRGLISGAWVGGVIVTPFKMILMTKKSCPLLCTLDGDEKKRLRIQVSFLPRI